MKLFIDTWGWLAIIDQREKEHVRAVNEYGQWFKKQGTLYTTDYILDETNTLLFRRLPFHLAEEGIRNIRSSVEFGQLELEWITPSRFQYANELRLRFRDKPDISFTDLTSMVVMQDLRITHILSADAHFQHVGLGFQLLPQR